MDSINVAKRIALRNASLISGTLNAIEHFLKRPCKKRLKELYLVSNYGSRHGNCHLCVFHVCGVGTCRECPLSIEQVTSFGRDDLFSCRLRLNVINYDSRLYSGLTREDPRMSIPEITLKIMEFKSKILGEVNDDSHK